MAEAEPELVSKRYSSNSFPRWAEPPCAALRRHLHGQAACLWYVQAEDGSLKLWIAALVNCKDAHPEPRRVKPAGSKRDRDAAEGGQAVSEEPDALPEWASLRDLQAASTLPKRAGSADIALAARRPLDADPDLPGEWPCRLSRHEQRVNSAAWFCHRTASLAGQR